MTVQYAENAAAAYYDRQAQQYLKKAADLEEQADKAANPKSKQKYRQTAQKYRKGAIEALKAANIAARKPRGVRRG
jgi:hypothetical protein